MVFEVEGKEDSVVWEVCVWMGHGFQGIILVLKEIRLGFGTLSFMMGLQGFQWLFDFYEGKI